MTPAASIEIVRSPWHGMLLDDAARTHERLRIAAPYVKTDAARSVLAVVPSQVSIDVLTDFHLRSFEAGASDVEAFRQLLQRGAHVRHRSRLHAKLYVFDTRRAIVTSGNLTRPGLKSNIEFGVALLDQKLVERIAGEFDILFSAAQRTSKITDEILVDAQAILDKIPRRDRAADRRMATQSRQLLERETEVQNRSFQAGSGPVLAGLTGWKRDVFELLDSPRLPERFTIMDIYGFESVLARKHPRNVNVRPKIRQTLQYLRNLGLLEFERRGEYRKLWIQ